MKIIKVGKFVLVRHWFRWYFMHQAFGVGMDERNWLVPAEFPKKVEAKDVTNNVG